MKKTVQRPLSVLLAVLIALSVFTVVPAAAATETVTDVLTAADFKATSTTYTDFSGVTKTSGAVYAGNSAKDSSGNIQLRSSNSNSGIVTTASGGKVRKVTVEWNSNTASGRTLNIYGKNTAYSAANDLYNYSNRGTLIGSIVYGTSTELTIDGDYEYIGLRSNSNAMYLGKIEIVWEKESSTTTTHTVTWNYKDSNGNDTSDTT